MKLVRKLFLFDLLLMIICSFFTYLIVIQLIMLFQFAFLVILLIGFTIDWTKIQLLSADKSKRFCIIYLIFISISTIFSFLLIAHPGKYFIIYKVVVSLIVVLVYLLAIYFYKKMINNLPLDINHLDDYKVNSDSIIGMVVAEVFLYLIMSNVLCMNIKNFEVNTLWIFAIILVVSFILFWRAIEKVLKLSKTKDIIGKYRIISLLTFLLANSIIALVIWFTAKKGEFLFVYSLLVICDSPCLIVVKKITFKYLTIEKILKE